MVLEEIISTYFIYPLVNKTGEYNVVNTITYAAILFTATYLLYTKILKNRIKIDAKFAAVFASFTVFAASVHVLDDMKIVVSNLLVTPLIQAVMFAAFLLYLSAALLIQKYAKIEYWKTLITITLLPSVIIIAFIFSRAQNFAGLAYVLVAFALSTSILFAVHKKFPNALTKENLSVLSSHMLDASSTFVSINFFGVGSVGASKFASTVFSGYTEQHFAPAFLVNMFGPAVMFPLKLVVIGFVLYAFDKEIKDKQMRTFFKILVLILGLAPGLRDTLRLSIPA